MGQTASVKRSQSDIQAFLDKEKEKFLEKYENPLRQNGSLEDFELLRTIGTGSFGKIQKIVFLFKFHFVLLLLFI